MEKIEIFAIEMIGTGGEERLFADDLDDEDTVVAHPILSYHVNFETSESHALDLMDVVKKQHPTTELRLVRFVESWGNG